MKLRLAVAIISLVIVTSLGAQNSAPPIGSPTRAITEKDLFDFVWVANPQLSPDGTRVAFIRVNVDEKRTGYETSIWMVATSGSEAPVRMTNGKHDAQPRWSPDGKRIAFVRGGDKDETGKPKPPQIAMLSLAGGEAWILTTLPKGASGPVWSPDSKRIAFLSSTTSEDIEKARRNKDSTKSKETGRPESTDSAGPKQGEPESEHESDVHVISSAVYRSNDAGYLDPKRHEHIWILEVPTASDELAKPLQITSGGFNERELVWSPDSSRIYFLTERIDEPYYELPTTDIYSVPAAGGSLEKLATVPMGIYNLALSPDGRKFAFHGSVTQPVRSYSQPDLWVMDAAPNAPAKNLTADYDFDMGSSVGGDNAAPRGGNGRHNAGIHLRSRDAPSSPRNGRGRPDRVAGEGAVDRKSTARTRLRAKAGRARIAGDHRSAFGAGRNRRGFRCRRDADLFDHVARVASIIINAIRERVLTHAA